MEDFIAIFSRTISSLIERNNCGKPDQITCTNAQSYNTKTVVHEVCKCLQLETESTAPFHVEVIKFMAFALVSVTVDN